jgi:hypothetical protein
MADVERPPAGPSDACISQAPLGPGCQSVSFNGSVLVDGIGYWDTEIAYHYTSVAGYVVVEKFTFRSRSGIVMDVSSRARYKPWVSVRYMTFELNLSSFGVSGVSYNFPVEKYDEINAAMSSVRTREDFCRWMIHFTFNGLT